MFLRKKRPEPGSVTEARRIIKAMIDAGLLNRKFLARVGWLKEHTDCGLVWQTTTFKTRWSTSYGVTLTMVKKPEGWRLEEQVELVRYADPYGVTLFNAFRQEDGSYRVAAA
jgi:hypothetical protein